MSNQEIKYEKVNKKFFLYQIGLGDTLATTHIESKKYGGLGWGRKSARENLYKNMEKLIKKGLKVNSDIFKDDEFEEMDQYGG